jgi:hypothetical protein
MKKTKFLLTILLCIFAFAFTRAQGIQAHVQDPDIIEPGSKSISQAYLKPRNIFEKLSWFDSTGKLVRQRVLNLVTRVDSAHNKLIFLQIRNDGYRDSTIAEWPSLKPVYTEENVFGTITSYDYSGEKIKIVDAKDGKKISDTSITPNAAYFDGFLSDYLYGALPLKPGYRAQMTFGGDRMTKVTLREIHTDVLITGEGNIIQANLVIIDFSTTYSALFWFDISTGEMLKSIYRSSDGSIFMKSRV